MGIARRDVLHGTLQKIACGVEPYASRVDGGFSKGESPIQIADSLEGLVSIGREFIKDRNPGIVVRRKTTRLTTAWLDEAASHAAEFRTLGDKTAVVRSAPAVSASDVAEMAA